MQVLRLHEYDSATRQQSTTLGNINSVVINAFLQVKISYKVILMHGNISFYWTEFVHYDKGS